MKIILVCIILFFAVGVAMALVARLSQTGQRLADLQKQLGRSDEELARQRRELERLAAEEDVRRRNV